MICVWAGGSVSSLVVMKLVSWNVRGLEESSKRALVRRGIISFRAG